MIIYLMHVWPLETTFATKMEVFNECTIIVLHYGLMCFTDYVPEPSTRYQIGWPYIALFLSNLLVHLSLLVLGSSKQVNNCCRRRYYNRRRALALSHAAARMRK